MRGASDQISLRLRVAVLAALMVGMAAAGVSAAAFYVVRGSMYSGLDQQLIDRARTVVDNGLVASLPAAALYGSDIRIGLLTAQSTLITVRDSLQPPFDADELEVAAGKLTSSLRTVNDERVLAVPSGSPGIALVLAQPMEPMRHTLAGLGVVLALVGGAGVVLAGLAGATVAGAGLRPVQRLTSATERVASTGDLRPIPVTGTDELARLTHSFNVMLGAVAAARDQQRRLVADAGHELRTPLTSLRTNMELLMAAGSGTGPGARTLSEADRKEIFDDVHGQLEELSTLVGDLVELARDDAPQAANESVDLVDVVERALARARRRAGEVSFSEQLAPWMLPGDATALERAVLNLLDNAVKWSPPRGVVRVGLHPVGDDTAMLEVADAGPGIAEADRPHVFERFYRATEDRGRPGSGLGLSIVKQVVERHGGSVRVGRSAAGGALLALQLPGSPAEPPS
jgi:two-component system sensor histidine kinase MprB